MRTGKKTQHERETAAATGGRDRAGPKSSLAPLDPLHGRLRPCSAAGDPEEKSIQAVDLLAVTHSLSPCSYLIVRLARDKSRAENLMRIHIHMFNRQKCMRGSCKSATSVNSSGKEYKSA